MNSGPFVSKPSENDCAGFAGVGDGDKGLIRSVANKLVFERQSEFARELLCFMFDTGAMADVEVVTDDSCSIRSHVEVLVRVSGYFRRTLLQGNLISLRPRQVREVLRSEVDMAYLTGYRLNSVAAILPVTGRYRVRIWFGVGEASWAHFKFYVLGTTLMSCSAYLIDYPRTGCVGVCSDSRELFKSWDITHNIAGDSARLGHTVCNGRFNRIGRVLRPIE